MDENQISLSSFSVALSSSPGQPLTDFTREPSLLTRKVHKGRQPRLLTSLGGLSPRAVIHVAFPGGSTLEYRCLRVHDGPQRRKL